MKKSIIFVHVHVYFVHVVLNRMMTLPTEQCFNHKGQVML